MSKEKHTQSLTPKQEMFCQEYIIDFNGTRAAIAAGYSEKTADVIAVENLGKPKIKLRLEELTNSRAEKLEITQEQVLRDLMLARDITLGIKPHKVQTTVDGLPMTVEIEKTDMNNFIKINELYMKHLGMFIDRQEITHNGNLAVYTPQKREDN